MTDRGKVGYIDSVCKSCYIFEKNGFFLYLVGGTVRDFLLGLKLSDVDAVTNATPEDMKNILDDIKSDFTFSKFGFVKVTFEGIKFDITTLRKETGYLDCRHPRKIVFIDDPAIDVQRRDFTVNALYMTSDLKILDFVNGENDLKNRTLRMIGDPKKRIQEDPLRIIRAIRFALTYNFDMDSSLEDAIHSNIQLLERLNKDKIIQDLKKIKCNDRAKVEKMFNEFSIHQLIDVVD